MTITAPALTLHFDADESLIRLGNGEWLLRPVIVITGNNVSVAHQWTPDEAREAGRKGGRATWRRKQECLKASN